MKSYFVSSDNCPAILEKLLMVNNAKNGMKIIFVIVFKKKAVKCLEGNWVTILAQRLAQRKQDLFYSYETYQKIKLDWLKKPYVHINGSNGFAKCSNGPK